MRRGSIGESIFATYACVHSLTVLVFIFLLIFRLTQRENSMPLALAGCAALAPPPSPLSPRPVLLIVNTGH